MVPGAEEDQMPERKTEIASIDQPRYLLKISMIIDYVNRESIAALARHVDTTRKSEGK